ncbi:MAG TPA: gpW family head-tail joining protein [Caulobacteraceae bacterium]|nr:gpW family head-tail joining protein [Caulobacteraceae bacterium]
MSNIDLDPNSWDPTTSILAGFDPTALQAQLTALQQAYLDLSSGAKGEQYSYTQGDGAKAVTYTRANLGQLVQAIKLVQAQLGIIQRPRRALRMRF